MHGSTTRKIDTLKLTAGILIALAAGLQLLMGSWVKGGVHLLIGLMFVSWALDLPKGVRGAAQNHGALLVGLIALLVVLSLL